MMIKKPSVQKSARLLLLAGMDISRSMVAVGREFAFPINFSKNAHITLTTSSPKSVTSYSKDLATWLSACREIAHLLLQEQRAWHRELVISRRPDPRTYSVGDIVFARRSVQSSKSAQRVDKLTFAYTDPWRIIQSLRAHRMKSNIASNHLGWIKTRIRPIPLPGTSSTIQTTRWPRFEIQPVTQINCLQPIP